MVLVILFLKNCPICDIRCDKQGKKNLVEIKDEQFRKKLEIFYNAEKTIGIGDYLCKKHIVQLRRSIHQVTEQRLQEENLTPINDFVFETSNEATIDFATECDFENDTINVKTNDKKIFKKSESEAENEKIDCFHDPSFIMVNIPRTYASHSFCFICKVKSGKLHN